MHNAEFTLTIDNKTVIVAFNTDWSGQALILIDDRNITLPAELFVHMTKFINDQSHDTMIDNLK